MLKDIFFMIHGCIIWKTLRFRYRIEDRDAVLVLPDNDELWNNCGIKYLTAYMQRKGCKKAYVLYTEENNYIVNTNYMDSFQKVLLKRTQMLDLLRYYCLYRFSDSIVFLFLHEPRDNRSAYVLEKTRVSMEELVCIGFYKLEKVPVYV